MAQAIEEQDASSVRQALDRTLRNFIGYRLKRGFGLVLPGLNEVFAKHDMTLTSSSALIIIADNPALTQSNLSNVLGLKRSNMVRVIDELERRGFVSREKVPGDGRAHALQPTTEGRALAAKITEEIGECEEKIYSVLNQQQQAQLLHLLSLIEQGNK